MTSKSTQQISKAAPALPHNASINDCERLAQETDSYNTATFDLVGPTGRIKARWLDAYMGLVRIEGSDGFCMSRDFDSPGIRCENFSTGRAALPA